MSEIDDVFDVPYEECECCHNTDGLCDCWGSLCPKCGKCCLDCMCDEETRW